MKEENYVEAIMHCASNILPMHFSQRVLNKIFGQATQSHAAGLLVIMHCEAQLGIGPPPTLSALQQRFERPRTLATFIGLLKHAGFVKTETSLSDGRSKILVPEAQLRNGLTEWLQHHLHCTKIAGIPTSIEEPSRTLVENEDFALRFIANTRAVLDHVRREIQKDHAWAWIDKFDCGDRVGLMLLDSHYRNATTDRADHSFQFDVQTLAMQIGISRSHVYNIIKAGSKAGYFHIDKNNGLISLSHRFLKEARDWHLFFWSLLADAVEVTSASFSKGQLTYA